jgi:hypothetical protein
MGKNLPIDPGAERGNLLCYIRTVGPYLTAAPLLTDRRLSKRCLVVVIASVLLTVIIAVLLGVLWPRQPTADFLPVRLAPDHHRRLPLASIQGGRSATFYQAAGVREKASECTNPKDGAAASISVEL